MSMGRRKTEQQRPLFLLADDLPKSAGPPFYVQLNRLLAAAGFDAWIEARCQPYYAAPGTPGRPSIPPGVYFRRLFVGDFEDLDSQRSIACRCASSWGRRWTRIPPITRRCRRPGSGCRPRSSARSSSSRCRSR